MTAMIDDSPSTARPDGKRPARPGGQRASGQIREIRARRPLAQAGQPATAVPTFLVHGPQPDRVWVAAAFLLGAIAGEVLGDPDAGRALQHALDLADTDQALAPSLSHPPPGPAGRRHRHPSAAGTLTGQIADLADADRPSAPPRLPARVALTHGETRVLHYLPTNLSAREIAGQLYLSVNTVKTHQRHLYQKLGARSRTQAVQQARALGLLASPSRRR
jgi:LuxR family transcriptional regulator, maltose regulon positive regulatory protein